MKLLKTVALTLAVTTLTAFSSEISFVTNAETEKNEINETENVVEEKLFAFTESRAFISETELSVSAKSAILCTDSGLVLYGKQENVPLPMASITKVMTAIVALERLDDLSVEITVPREAVGTEGSSVYLKNGESVTLEMLIYSAMLESANDATAALAIAVSGSQADFVAEMNKKAKELGMESTLFANPHGLPANEHYTTCSDYARLMSYALKNDAFREIISTKKKIYPSADGSLTRVLTNHNRLLSTYKDMIGGKTGFTKTSGRTLVTAAERDGTTLICVTINASDDWNDHTSLFDEGFRRVRTESFTDSEKDVAVACGKAESVKCNFGEKLLITAENDAEIEVRYFVPRMLFAPVSKGQAVGYAVFYSDGKEILRKAMYAESAVEASAYNTEKNGFLDKITGFFKWKS